MNQPLTELCKVNMHKLIAEVKMLFTQEAIEIVNLQVEKPVDYCVLYVAK